MQILPNDPCACKAAKLAKLATVESDRTLGGVLVGDRKGGDETMGDIFTQIASIFGAPIYTPTTAASGGQVQGSVGGSIGGSLGSGVGGSAVGTVQPNAREVVIEIKGSPADGWFYSEKEWIENVLEARGWNITNVGQISGAGGAGVWRVTAMVGNQYSDAQIVTNARNHLAAQGMTVTGVAIVQASQATYVSGNVAPSGGDGSNASGFNSMIAGAALGLGVSSTVLIVGGVAVAVLLLRRR